MRKITHIIRMRNITYIILLAINRYWGIEAKIFIQYTMSTTCLYWIGLVILVTRCDSMSQDKKLALELLINACNEYQINVTKSISVLLRIAKTRTVKLVILDISSVKSDKTKKSTDAT